MLDNQYAILFIRGERPVMDFKYDILKHPNVALTTDGKASAYKHGEVTVKHSSISVLSIDPEELPEESYGETNYELLSDEDFEVNKPKHSCISRYLTRPLMKWRLCTALIKSRKIILPSCCRTKTINYGLRCFTVSDTATTKS